MSRVLMEREFMEREFMERELMEPNSRAQGPRSIRLFRVARRRFVFVKT